MKFFAVFSILFTFRTFEQLLLALENRVCWIHCIECIFYPSEFWTTCACSEKHSLPWKFSLHWNNDFWGTCACSENRDFPEILHFIECSFYIQDFWATCACPEKESVPWIHCIEYIFFIIPNFELPALALKNRIYPEIFHGIEILFIFQEIFHCIEYSFYIQDFWATWACPEFFKPGGRPAPRLVRHWLRTPPAPQFRSLAMKICCRSATRLPPLDRKRAVQINYIGPRRCPTRSL